MSCSVLRRFRCLQFRCGLNKNGWELLGIFSKTLTWRTLGFSWSHAFSRGSLCFSIELCDFSWRAQAPLCPVVSSLGSWRLPVVSRGLSSFMTFVTTHVLKLHRKQTLLVMPWHLLPLFALFSLSCLRFWAPLSFCVFRIF